MASPKDMLDIIGLGEPKAEEQLAIVQIDALNRVCSQFPDPDKKWLRQTDTNIDTNTKTQIIIKQINKRRHKKVLQSSTDSQIQTRGG